MAKYEQFRPSFTLPIRIACRDAGEDYVISCFLSSSSSYSSGAGPRVVQLQGDPPQQASRAGGRRQCEWGTFIEWVLLHL